MVYKNNIIVDFELGVNTMVLLTNEGEVYMAGQGRHFNLKKLNLPSCENGKVVNIGVAESNAIIHMDNGNVYSKVPLIFDSGNKYFSKEKLYKIQNKNLKKMNGLKITGKYDTVAGYFP